MITVERSAVETVGTAPELEAKAVAVPEVAVRSRSPSVFFARRRLTLKGLSRQGSVTALVAMLLAGLVMGVVLYPLARFPIYVSLPVGGLAYLVAIYLIRAIEPEEWRLARQGLLARLRPNRAA